MPNKLMNTSINEYHFSCTFNMMPSIPLGHIKTIRFFEQLVCHIDVCPSIHIPNAKIRQINLNGLPIPHICHRTEVWMSRL